MPLYDKGLNVIHGHFHFPCHDLEEEHTRRTGLFVSVAHSSGPGGLRTTPLASKAQIDDPLSSPSVVNIIQILVRAGLAS